MSTKPPAPPKPKRPKKAPSPPAPLASIDYDPFARDLATTVREAHGMDQAATLDMSEQLAAPRGFVGTRNIALERALGGGIPLGRVTEISGWEGSGKSTALDQIIAQCQIEGGLGALADTEKGRSNPQYMDDLGVRRQSLVMIGGQTCEAMFSEVETLARRSAHINCEAWVAALVREGIKCPKPSTYVYEVFDGTKDGNGRRKSLAKYRFVQWGREQAAALMEYQKAHGLPAYGIRDGDTREALRPVALFGEAEQQAAALEAWQAGDPHPFAQPADRPIVIGWDSVAGTATEEELQGDARDVHPATAAKVIRRNMRRLIQLIHDEAIAFVLINQRYEKIMTGWSPGGGRGRQSETYGGGGIKYHATIRIEMDRVGAIYESATSKTNGEPPIGQEVRIRVPKNKVQSPYHTEVFGLIFGRGAENAYAIYEDMKKRGLIRVAGGWSQFADSSITGGKSFHGWMGLANMMAEDPALYDSLAQLYMDAR